MSVEKYDRWQLLLLKNIIIGKYDDLKNDSLKKKKKNTVKKNTVLRKRKDIFHGIEKK
jgi:hypothetical protein